jgi:hypothetical protein
LGNFKARTCANRRTQLDYINQNEAASLTTLTETHLITAVIDAKQRRDVMTADIPNVFVQIDIEKKNNSEKPL